MALGNYTTFTLDMVPGGAPPIIHVSAGDVGRKYTANLTYNGEPYDIQGNRLTIAGTKPDGTVFEYPADDFEQGDSWVDFIIEEQMAIVPGTVRCKLREYLNEDQIGSATFIMDVDEYVYDPEAASESYVPQIEDAINEAVENVADTITEAATEGAIDSVKQYADDAEAWATGSVDGTDVTSTADQYHNNAKYYAEQAGEKATAAAGSATDAAASAAEAMSTTPDGYAAVVDILHTLNSNNQVELIKPSAYASRVTIVSGGYAVFGNTCYVNVQFYIANNDLNNKNPWGVLQNLPECAVADTPLTIYGGNSVGAKIGSSSGKIIYAWFETEKTADPNTLYTITGMYQVKTAGQLYNLPPTRAEMNDVLANSFKNFGTTSLNPDDITEPGAYYCSSNTAPFSNSIRLIVMKHNTVSMQIALENANSDKFYIRQYSSGSWKPWYKYSGTAIT